MKTCQSNILATFSFLVLMLVGPLVYAQESSDRNSTEQETGAPQRDQATHLHMQAKLVNCEKVLKGLVIEDFSLILEGARQMKAISGATHWPKADDAVYRHHEFAFRQQCEKLIGQAERRDLQAAHYSYLHLSTSCIDCHSYVRGRFRVERSGDEEGGVKLIPAEWDGQGPQPKSSTDKGASGQDDKAVQGGKSQAGSAGNKIDS